jgi:hypothetical protein
MVVLLGDFVEDDETAALVISEKFRVAGSS